MKDQFNFIVCETIRSTEEVALSVGVFAFENFLGSCENVLVKVTFLIKIVFVPHLVRQLKQF